MKVKIPADNPIVCYMDKHGLRIVLAIKNKDKLDIMKAENAILLRLTIPNEHVPKLMYLTARRTLALFIRAKAKPVKPKPKEVDIEEIFGKAKEISTEEVEAEDLASLIK